MSKWSVAKETVESVGQLAAENAADEVESFFDTINIF